MSEIAKFDPHRDIIQTGQQPMALTPLDMLNTAVQRGADITVLEKLMALQERWEATRARKAFDAAVSEAKAEIPPITKNAIGHNERKYADFSAIARTIDPILAKHGLSYRFRTNQTDKIHVTCILSHRDGHSEETALAGPVDNSGNKNAIQAIGSTLTYLQRYSLVQSLGLSATSDDDGKSAASGETISDEQARALKDGIASVDASEAAFLNYLKIDRIEDLKAAHFSSAMDALGRKRAGKAQK